MICYRDITYCASPKCQNKCGRMFTTKDQIDADRWGATFNRPGQPAPIAFSYFCDERGELLKQEIHK